MIRRFPEVDTIKAAGILTVVLIHSIRPDWHPFVSPFEIWLGSVTSFAVPGFLWVSGFLYASGEPAGWHKTWARIRRIGVPYLIASVGAQLYSGNAWRGSASEIFTDFATGNSFGPYYYVFVILTLVLVTPICARLRPNVLLGLTALSLVVQAAFAGGWLPGDAIPTFWRARHPLLWWSYFLSGWVVRLHYAAVSTWIVRQRRAAVLGLLAVALGLAVGLAAEVAVEIHQTCVWLHNHVVIALLFAFSCQRSASPPRLRSLSDTTYSVYLFHLFFVYTAQRWLPAARGEFELIPVLLPWAAGLAGSALVISLARRLLGERSRPLIGA